MTLPVLPCSAVVLGLVINSPSSVAAFCLLAKAAEAVFRTQVFRPRFQKQYANKNNNQMTQNISSLQMFCGFRVVFFKCSHNHISLISCFFTTNSPSCLEICHVHTFEAKNLVQRIAQRFPLFLESKKQFLSGFRNPLKSIQIPLWLQIILLCVCGGIFGNRGMFWRSTIDCWLIHQGEPFPRSLVPCQTHSHHCCHARCWAVRVWIYNLRVCFVSQVVNWVWWYHVEHII